MTDESEDPGVDIDDLTPEQTADVIRSLLGKQLVQALSGQKVKVSDSILRSAATYLRLYGSKKSANTLPHPEETVSEIAKGQGSAPLPPFPTPDDEMEL